MAVDIFTTSEPSISPRISFSHDLNDPSSHPNPTDPIRSDQLLLSPTFDFNFLRTTSILTPADELFSNGKILPTQIKTTQIVQTPNTKQTNKHTQDKKQLKEFIQDHDQEKDQENEKPSSRSFFPFRRSASMNCDNNAKGPKGLLRSLSIKSLSRSNSTGSALNPKPSSGQKVVEKKDPMFLRRCSSLNQPCSLSSSSSSSHVYYSYLNSSNSKNGRGGIRINPILNVPPAYNISKGTINFFGFGSIFCNGKVKKKTKT